MHCFVFLIESLCSVCQLSWWLCLSCWLKWSQRANLHFRGRNQKLSAVWPPFRIVSARPSWSAPRPAIRPLKIWATRTHIRSEIHIWHNTQWKKFQWLWSTSLLKPCITNFQIVRKQKNSICWRDEICGIICDFNVCRFLSKFAIAILNGN